MKRLLTLLLISISCFAYGQTTLPTGSKVISNTHYQAPNGDMYLFRGLQYAPNAYVKLTKQTSLDSLLAGYSTTSGGGVNQLAYYSGTTGITSYARAKVNAQGGYSTIGFGNGTPGVNDVTGEAPHLFEILNDNTNQQVFAIKTYGPIGATPYQNNVHYVRADGTQSAPTNTKSGMFFNSNGYRGYDGSSFTQSAAAFQAIATENFTTTGHGSEFHFETTANGSLFRLPAFRVRQNQDIWGAQNLILYATEKKAWHSNYRTVTMSGEVGIRSSLNSSEIALFNNIYYDTEWKRANGGYGSLLLLDQTGGLSFLSAPNGSAGTSATLTTAMSISAAGTVTSVQYNVSNLNTAPASASASGVKGEIRFTSSGIFICIATNSWIKCVGASF